MRLNVVKSKNATSFYVIKTIYIDKKEKTIIVEKLGTEKELREKLGDINLHEWAKERVAELNRLEKEGKEPNVIAEYSPSKLINKNSQRAFNGGYLFLQDIYYELGLHNICTNITKKYKL